MLEQVTNNISTAKRGETLDYNIVIAIIPMHVISVVEDHDLQHLNMNLLCYYQLRNNTLNSQNQIQTSSETIDENVDVITDYINFSVDSIIASETIKLNRKTPIAKHELLSTLNENILEKITRNRSMLIKKSESIKFHIICVCASQRVGWRAFVCMYVCMYVCVCVCVCVFVCMCARPRPVNRIDSPGVIYSEVTFLVNDLHILPKMYFVFMKIRKHKNIL